jgi:chloride channel 3/4/5
MDNRIDTGYIQMMLFFSVWYFFTITTYGTNVPAGLFLPGMIIGCALGNLYSKSMDDLGIIQFDVDDGGKMHDAIRKKYIIIGCGAFMAGYTRMTYSLGVIIMETS